MLTLVIGPCGAGKTTWARSHRPEDYHPDAEHLTRTLVATPERHRLHPHIRALGRRLLTTAVEHLLAGGHPVCVTVRGATRAERAVYTTMAIRHTTGTHVVRLLTPPEVCIRRAQADPDRPPTSQRAWPDIVDNWFGDYEPVAPGAEGFTYEEIPC